MFSHKPHRIIASPIFEVCYSYGQVTYTDLRGWSGPIATEFRFIKGDKWIYVYENIMEKWPIWSVSISEKNSIINNLRQALEWAGWNIRIIYSDHIEDADRTNLPPLGAEREQFDFKPQSDGTYRTDDGYLLLDNGQLAGPDGGVVGTMDSSNFFVDRGTLATHRPVKSAVPEIDQSLPKQTRSTISNWLQYLKSAISKPKKTFNLPLPSSGNQSPGSAVSGLKHELDKDDVYHGTGWSVTERSTSVEYSDASGTQVFWEQQKGGGDGWPRRIFIRYSFRDWNCEEQMPLSTGQRDEFLDRVVVALSSAGGSVCLDSW